MASGAIPTFDEFSKQHDEAKGGVPRFDDFSPSFPKGKATGMELLGGSAPPPRVGGQKVLDYTTGTLSNVPSSAWNLAKGVGTAIAHPIDTVGNLAKVVTGTAQNMTPGYVTPDRPGYSKEADAAWDAVKQRYGSPHAIAESIRTDPVGVASDIAAVAGGVSGLARGAEAVATKLPRVASAAGKIADVAGAVSDATNPVNLVTKPVGAALKGTARGLTKSALALPGRTERYGATPAQAALEHTSGITPEAVKASASARLDTLNKELEGLAQASGNSPDLTAARKVIADEIAKVKAANGMADDLTPMQEQLTKARTGFAGAVDPTTGDIAATQDPTTFLGMKRQFGDDFTKFDAAVPMKNSARKVGNRAYHEMSSEFNKAVPGAQPINQEMQSLIPVRDAAQRVSEHAGPIQNVINRATRPTGGLAAGITGFVTGGPLGAAAALAGQEALSSPTVKMGMARGAYGAGKAASSPIASRTINAAGVAGKADDTVASQLSRAILGGNQ